MKVSIKSFDVQMDVKNKGIEFEVYDNKGNFLGDFIVTKAKVIWCEGKTSREKGLSLNWTKAIEKLKA